MSLLRRPQLNSPEGRVQHVTPQNAGWKYVGFEVYDIAQGKTLKRNSGNNEICAVFLSGLASVRVGKEHFPDVGKRMSVFEKTNAHAVYIPAGTDYEITARTPVEVALAQAPGTGKFSARHIKPEEVANSTRGQGTNTRYIADILPDTKEAESLLVVEVQTPGGHWSSYPSHKHDQDSLPEESFLEETYYHRFEKPQGFGFQRVYTDDGSIDEAMTIQDRDVVLVPKGYHPVAAAHGYNLYYLNVMAGPKRAWHFSTEAAHCWLLKSP